MSGRSEFRSLGDLTANGANAPVDVSAYARCGVQVLGTFSANAQVEVSLVDAGGDDTFGAVGDPLTAPGIVDIPFPVQRVRVLVSSFSSGTVESAVSYVVQA